MLPLRKAFQSPLRKWNKRDGDRNEAATASNTQTSSTAPQPTRASPVPRVDHLPPEQALLTAQPTSNSTSSSISPSTAASTSDDDTSQDLWAQAYEMACGREPDLMADYGRHLTARHDAAGLLSTPQSVKPVVKQLLDDREMKQWRISLLGRDIKVRKQAEKLAKFLLWSDDIVKSAVSAQPYAALAWTAVSVLLPVRHHSLTPDLCLPVIASYKRYCTT